MPGDLQGTDFNLNYMSYKPKDVTGEVKKKAAHFCAYQERAPLEVRKKLSDYGLIGDEIEQILEELISESFLNENRFAMSYAHGKFRLKKWGKIRIRMGLEQYEINPNCIANALETISNDEYRNILKHLVDKKWLSASVSDPYIRKHKVAQYMMSKGFEPDLVWEILKDLRS